MKAREDKRREPHEVPVQDRRRVTAEGELRKDVQEEQASPEEEGGEPGGMALAETVPLAQLEQAEKRAEEAERRLVEFRDAFRRYREEHDAIRSRLERDLESRVRSSLGSAFHGLLGALDSLDRALEFADESPLAQGMLMVRQQIFDSLRESGLAPVEVVGRPFDPEVAEAIETVPVEDPAQANIVRAELRRGYRFGDQLLRPAQVRVGIGAEESAAGPGQSSD
jgi:molecular chaperone GrpE